MTPWDPRGSGSGRRRFQVNQRVVIIAAVSAVLLAISLRSGKLQTYQLIYFCVLVPSIILHEISHGVVALAFGDSTAKRAGRISLNPLKHIDPVGTLLVPAVLSLSGLGAYGWAKPVPVMSTNLRSPRNHIVLVALVGPTTNFILAALMGVCFVAAGGRNALLTGVGFSLLQQIFYLAGLANIVLGVFNFIPCPPLDGAAVLERFIPERYLPGYYNLQPFLMFLPFILILLFHGAWSSLIDHLQIWYLQRLV